MKKFIAILAVAIMALSLGTVASFATTTQDNGPFKNLEVNYSDATDVTDIPVYGYVGPEGPVTDDASGSAIDSPDVAPISVSVPTKLFWAAFQSNGGTITAPKYQIANNSGDDINVKLTSFKNANSSTSDNDLVDKYLDLNLASTASSADFTKTAVVDGDGTNAKYRGVATDMQEVSLGTLEDEDTWGFTFDGTWTGTWPDDAYEPKYTMVLTFSVPTETA
jgi:hypothetical protein